MSKLTFLKLASVGVLVLGFIILGVSLQTDNPTTSTTKEVDTIDVSNVQPPPSSVALTKKTILNLDLNAKNVIVLSGEVDESALTLATLVSEVTRKGEPAYLLINSPGGSVLDGAMIISAIESANAPVYTICLQTCASMAAIIHQYGTKRYMVDRSFLMFHDAAGGLRGYLPHMHSRLTTIERYITKFDAFISERTGMPLDELIVAQHRELWIDGEDSVNRKFADSLVSVRVHLNGKTLDLNAFLKNTSFRTNKKSKPANDLKSFVL